MKNKKLQQMVYVDNSPIHGKGVFARCRIRRGEFIGTFEGPPARRDGTHVMWIYEDDEWEGRRGRNELRYLNHADPANAVFEEFDLYARRTIAADEEITINYDD